MGYKDFNSENMIFDFVDKIKAVISTEIWENIFLNGTKNEIFILLLLYRNKQVNMTQIAEYVNVPLNTATGIVARMEKRGWVKRERSAEDKRVVTIALDRLGQEHMSSILKEFARYSAKVIECLSPEEMQTLGIVSDKVLRVLAEMNQNADEPAVQKTIKKITIE